MKIREILKDLLFDKDGNDKLSLSRCTASLTFLILSAGFLLTSWKRAAWEVFMAYPAGVMIVFVPQLFLRMVNKLETIIKARYGGE